ncbi:DUF2779 domain-containing protein [bacterium]|nr:DUF2779 domain-containing protein [bacterium]
MQQERLSLSKTKVVKFLHCEKKLWLSSYAEQQAAPSLDSHLQMQQGIEIGVVARALFPGGILVTANQDCSPETQTKQLVESNLGPIYEAAFVYEDTSVFIDILVPEEHGYHLIEIKAATKVSPHHITDTAIQMRVAEHAGLNVERVSVGCINNKFRYQGEGNYQGLIYLTDVTKAAGELLEEVDEWFDSARKVLARSEPLVEIGPQCVKPYKCEFERYCRSLIDDAPEYPLTDLKLPESKRKALASQGYVDALKTPPQLIESPKKKRIHQAILSGKPYVSKDAKKLVDEIPYPRYYLDFETLTNALPLWNDSRPYEQVPFQWSCHIETADNGLTHKEFLASPGSDPRDSCSKALIELFDGFDGSMVAYNAGFEKRILQSLAKAYPSTRDLFERVSDRSFDLLPICREHFYHRYMHGSWSIKDVIPVIASDLNYSDLAVSNGRKAQEAYIELLNGGLCEEEVKEIRTELLRYCGLDTLAMVRIARYFQAQR